MSSSLPSRRLLPPASRQLQCTLPWTCSNRLYPSRSILAISTLRQCRNTRHFQTSASSRKVPSLRPGAYTPQTKEASVKPSPGATTASRADKPHMDVQQRGEAAAARARARARIAEEENRIPEQGSLADNSLFADPLQHQRPGGPPAGSPTALGRQDGLAYDPAALELRNPSHLEAAINPKPRRRALWQRRMVMRSVRQRGRLTKTIKIARSERSCLSRSHFFKTSMKKLAPLARQIAGKPIDEAILQMRFSKKKVAQEVREHLLEAKHQAIVARGMGLGHLEQETSSDPARQPSPATTTITTLPLRLPNNNIHHRNPNPTPPTPSKPATLPGTSIPSNPTHRSPTDIYISQAWINRGPYGQKPDYRAFGRVYIMRPPHTGLSVLLKEEKTRAREKADREIKRIRQRMGRSMWTQLPDRKISRQGQYLLW
ncbi:hypothetical protein GJ744_000520 [Endocarpon pusillum]|uniref:Ribosomal protein L22 n=1 Tax=Endocarpon pusillum TaxID=364733 RepID=A0A8H7AEJ7_9EURO|nr:hypothetical protein GJ744_000520 [Endocarpon pusillum]